MRSQEEPGGARRSLRRREALQHSQAGQQATPWEQALSSSTARIGEITETKVIPFKAGCEDAKRS